MTARLAEPADVPALVGVLARAFDADPFVSWLVRSDAHRAAGYARFFELGLRALTMPYGEVYTNDACTGAAAWTPPGRWRMNLARQAWHVRHWAAICGWSRMLACQRATAPIVAAHPHEPHHYLFLLGVDPSAQGRGVGRELLAPILATCDRDKLPAYLETATERNLGFYQSLGFAVRGEHQIAAGPLVWMMWRTPL
jgi:ribosomal protein S18 acetylase RimI-like enzyme